jgi:hypothetical protein
MPERRDPTLKGLGFRMDTIEGTVATLETTLEKMVTLMQRIQWTFTGLAIYFVVSNLGLTETAKLAAKVVL